MSENAEELRRIFVSYTHQDTEFQRQLEAHLSPLLLLGRIDTWNDRKLRAGQKLYQEIKDNIRSADIVLMLVSSDYLASRSCREEMQLALDRARTRDAVAIPIIIRSCDWSILPLSDILATPKDGTPVSQWEDRDEAWTDVVKSIRELINDWEGSRTESGGEEQAGGPVASSGIANVAQDGHVDAAAGETSQQWVRRQADDSDWEAVKDALLNSLLAAAKTDIGSGIGLDGRRWGTKIVLDTYYPKYKNPRRLVVDDVGGQPNLPGYQLVFYERDGLLDMQERVRWLIKGDGTRALKRLVPSFGEIVYTTETYAAHLWELIKQASV